jgi:hypothetical protein
MYFTAMVVKYVGSKMFFCVGCWFSSKKYKHFLLPMKHHQMLGRKPVALFICTYANNYSLILYFKMRSCDRDRFLERLVFVHIKELFPMEFINSQRANFDCIWVNQKRNDHTIVYHPVTSYGCLLWGMNIRGSIFFYVRSYICFHTTRVALFHVTDGLAFISVQPPAVLKLVLLAVVFGIHPIVTSMEHRLLRVTLLALDGIDLIYLTVNMVLWAVFIVRAPLCVVDMFAYNLNFTSFLMRFFARHIFINNPEI